MDRAAKKKGDLLTVAIPARYGPPCRIGAQVAIGKDVILGFLGAFTPAFYRDDTQLARRILPHTPMHRGMRQVERSRPAER